MGIVGSICLGVNVGLMLIMPEYWWFYLANCGLILVPYLTRLHK